MQIFCESSHYGHFQFARERESCCHPERSRDGAKRKSRRSRRILSLNRILQPEEEFSVINLPRNTWPFSHFRWNLRRHCPSARSRIPPQFHAIITTVPRT